MNTSSRTIAFITLAFLLTSCATKGQSSAQVASNFINRQQVTTTTQQAYPSKNPQTVAVYAEQESPHKAYRIIGVASVSKYNLLGMKREDIALQKMMKQLAASIGGDAIINVKNNPESLEANVIAFQKILI